MGVSAKPKKKIRASKNLGLWRNWLTRFSGQADRFERNRMLRDQDLIVLEALRKKKKGCGGRGRLSNCARTSGTGLVNM